MSVSTLHTHRLARKPWPLAAAALGAAAIAVLHGFASQVPIDAASPLVIATHLYALMMVAALLWLAGAVGLAILRRAGLAAESALEHGVFAVGLGLGALAAVVVCLGLAHLLSPVALGVSIVAVAIAVRRELVTIGLGLPDGVRAALELRRSIREHGRALAMLVPVVEILFAALLLRALHPPFENDVLIYHVTAPQRFLAHGGLLPLPDIHQANMPLAVNMLYLLGLAFGSEELSSVLHLVLAALVAIATFSFGRRFFGPKVGWVAAATCLSTQLLIVVATVAFIDYGLAFFDFLAVYAFILGRESPGRQSERRGWLVVSGLLVGCALASKHLGLITAVSLGVWLLASVVAERRQLRLRGAVTLLLAFGVPAALMVIPWYAKNLVWFGNPVWPVLAPNPTGFNQYLGNTTRFGGTDGIFGPALVAMNLYVHGSIELPMVRPPLQLLAIPLYFLVPRHRTVTALLCLVGVQFLVWSQGAHVLRYALTALPGASIVAAYVLVRVMEAGRRSALMPAIASALVVLGLALPTTQTVATVFAEGSLPQIVGLESRQTFLDRKLDNFPLVEYLNDGREPVSRVLMVGDYRSYYVRQPTWVDGSMETMQRLSQAPDAQAARAILAEREISHVLVNSSDFLYFVPIDPNGAVLTMWRSFEAGRAGYLEPIATNRSSTLYRVIR